MKNLILIFIILFFPLMVRAQKSTRITGIVTDNKGNPLPGANIIIPTLHLGSAADNSGKYKFTVPAEYSKGQGVDLRAQYIGYKSQTTAITLTGDSIKQNFSLETDVFQSDEVVVTGLASKTSKARAEVSVSNVNAAALTETSSFQSISQLIEGQISGVQVTSSSGNTGGGFRFYVRGGGGLNGDGQPVVYVDGIRVASYEVTGAPDVGGQGISMLSILAPENIAKIQVLKGPAAAAMYGTSGSNGVVLITTKSGATLGSSRKLSVNYKYAYGLNTQSYKYKTSNFLSANSANAIFRNGITRQHALSLSGGSNLLRYYTSFDDRYEEGDIPNNNIDRKVLRANFTSNATSYLTLKISSGYSLTNIRRPLDDNTHMGFLMNVLSTPKAYSWGTDSAAVFQIKDESKIESFTGGIQITLTPLNNLTFYFNGGIDNNNRRQDQTYPQNLAVYDFSNGRRTIFNADYRQYTYDLNGRYTYNISGLHATSIIGAQLFDETDRGSSLGSENFETNLISAISAGSIKEYMGESFFNIREAGIFTENNFSYNNQYFLTLGLREDYASSIGPQVPSILYPKVSFALQLDKYNWFPSNLFGLFKLRAAYGESGQLPNDLAPISLLWGAANVGGKVGAVIKNIGNSSIKPERIKEFETGLDAEFLKKYSLEFTYYRQNASNSIFYKYESPSTGLTERPVPFNVGGIKNWGFESLLKASLIRSRDYRLDLSLIWNYQNNLVTNLGGTEPIISWVNAIKEGLPKHEFYDYKVLGAKFDSFGIYTGVENTTKERVDLGNPIPNHTGSFTIKFRFLKNFNLYALMNWALNRKMLNVTKAYAALNGDVPEYNILEAQLGITTDPEITLLKPGTQEYINAANRYARLDPNYASNYIEDAGYLKIRELSLSYNFRDFLPKTNYNYLKDIVIGVSVLNVWTFTKYSGADIELNATDNVGNISLARGIDFYTLQHPRVYNMWVRISL